ncbi:DUF554 domain-containing protein [Fimbriimonadia bacterium ATM]|nr:MAG: DUF554 domain-containing protein [Armatimonadota bacterium]MBC6970266.1 DUF554 domain-containing protein [Armatimonadota bacterium]MCE7899554.1 DUF554 domain-containing protein [Armatimonadetes bacterium ATM1]MDL1927642.1 DUF554 domain-containing protein [Fimbriimonadia bacterium ATM]RIJ96430.1 MAG: DUF554 domain-containing protein [Armatimonadota bacterium]
MSNVAFLVVAWTTATAATQTMEWVYPITRCRIRPIRGTYLNAATVLGGGLLGLAVGNSLPSDYKTLAQAAIGIGTIAMGIRMFLGTGNSLIPILSLIVGGAIGHLIGIQAGLDALGGYAKDRLGAGGRFQEAFVSSSVLFCVGPMTLLGCLEDGLRKKIDLLSIKSLLDGVSSIFFAASLGPGVLLTVGTVLVVQMPLTLAASKLRPLADRKEILNEVTSVGGLILMVIGLGLLELRSLPSADFLPGLLLAGYVASRLKPKSE